MTNIKSFLLFFVLLASTLSGCRRSVPLPSPSDSASRFVQDFYDWYTPIALKGEDTTSEIALKARPINFSPELTQSLHADSLAQAKAADEVDGLDFDPFLYSQDPDEDYRVTKVAAQGKEYLVEVRPVFEGKVDPATAVTAEVAGTEGHWYFVNFRYPGGRDLLGTLRRLHERSTHEALGDESSPTLQALRKGQSAPFSVKTGKGTLSVNRQDEPSPSSFLLRWNGKSLLSEDNDSEIDVAEIGRSADMPFLVLAFNSAGNGCPAFYRIVDLSVKSGLYLSPQIGNCSDVPTLDVQGRSVRLGFPALGYAKASQWTYTFYPNGQPGKLTHTGDDASKPR